MRYECEEAAFAGDYIELSDSWSRAQVRAIWASIPDDGTPQAEAEGVFLSMLRPKVLSVHLTCVDADPIVAASELVPERTEQMDTRLYAWFGVVWIRHLTELATLGEALRRTLYTTYVSQNGTEKETVSAV